MSKYTALLVAFVSLFSLAQKGGPQWKEFPYPNNGFAVSAPSAPNIHPDPQAPDVTIYSWQLDTGVRAVIHLGTRPNCLQVLDSLKKQALQASRKELSTAKDIVLDGHRGLESTGQRGSEYQYRERIYCVDNRAYAVTGTWTVGRPEPSVLKRWLESFRLMAK